ncbi:MAG: hypothetical protein K2Z81_06905, partial [Cyanobacteria bacterium]|nr:hypothetical protein [Cyanobacteriota bacterium]
AKTAKAKAEKEMGFPAMAANVQDVIATAEERYQPTSPEPFFPPEPASVTAPEEPPKPKPKTKRKKPVYDDLDDIPG